MDSEPRHIKVRRVFAKPHSRSLSENESSSTSGLPFVVRPRGRSGSDTMFSLVQVKRDKNEAREDKDSQPRIKSRKALQRPISTGSPYSAFGDNNEDENQKDNLFVGSSNEDFVVRRSRSGSGSMVFSSIRVKQDSEFSNARGYPINLLSSKYFSVKVQGWGKDDQYQEAAHDKHRSRAVSFSNQSLLHSAISRDDVDELSSLIDSENFDLNLPDEVGITMLHRAAIDGSYRCLNYLLSRGADVDVTDQEGWTPLHDTVFHGHIRCAVFLLISGADVEAETKDFMKPIEMAEDEEMILVVGRAMALNKTGQNSNYDKETLV